MGKIIFFILIFWSFLACGQESSDPDFNGCLWFGNIVIPSQEFLGSEEFRAPIESIFFDTLSIAELSSLRRVMLSSGDDDEVIADFVISKSRKNGENGELLGLYWPNGKILSLPDQAVAGTVKIKIQEGKIFLSWFQKEMNDGSYSLYFSELRPDLGVKEEKYVSIVPALRENRYKQKYVPTQDW